MRNTEIQIYKRKWLTISTLLGAVLPLFHSIISSLNCPGRKRCDCQFGGRWNIAPWVSNFLSFYTGLMGEVAYPCIAKVSITPIHFNLSSYYFTHYLDRIIDLVVQGPNSCTNWEDYSFIMHLQVHNALGKLCSIRQVKWVSWKSNVQINSGKTRRPMMGK